jgi:hypothetical protein
VSFDLSRSAFVVRPRTVTLSRVGDALWWLAVPWLFVMLALSAAAQRAGLLDLVATRVVVLATGVAPLVLVFGSPLLGRLPGLRWLLVSPQPGAMLNGDGIELTLPDLGVRWFPWREIERLELHETRWRQWGELRGVDGSRLANVPMNLVYLKETWLTAPTLAQAVVRMRPDLFVLTEARWGRADAFGRRGAGVVPIDQAEVGRAHTRRFIGVFVPLAVIGIVTLVVWLVRAA